MRLLMEVEARVNQADGLHKNEVSLGNFALKICMLAIHKNILNELFDHFFISFLKVIDSFSTMKPFEPFRLVF